MRIEVCRPLVWTQEVHCKEENNEGSHSYSFDISLYINTNSQNAGKYTFMKVNFEKISGGKPPNPKTPTTGCVPLPWAFLGRQPPQARTTLFAHGLTGTVAVISITNDRQIRQYNINIGNVCEMKNGHTIIRYDRQIGCHTVYPMTGTSMRS